MPRPKQNKAKASRPRRPRPARNSTSGGAPVNVRKTVVNRQPQNKVVRQSGTDILAHIDDVSTLTRGQVIVDALVAPNMVDRLKRIAGSFQRIKYVSMVFTIVNGSPSSQSGTYVAAFVKDATDVYNSGEGSIDKLMSNSGSKLQKLWDNTTIRVSNNRWFYTSDSAEIRFSSPGKLVVLMDGVASQKGSMTISMAWTVDLQQQTLEDDVETIPSLVFKYPVTVGVNFFVYVENHDPTGNADILAWCTTNVDLFDKGQVYHYKSPGSTFGWFEDQDSTVVASDSRTATLTWNVTAKIWELKVTRYDGTDFPTKPNSASAQEDAFLPGEELIPYEIPKEAPPTKDFQQQVYSSVPLPPSPSRPWSIWRKCLQKHSNQSEKRLMDSQNELEQLNEDVQVLTPNSPKLMPKSSNSRSRSPHSHLSLTQLETWETNMTKMLSKFETLSERLSTLTPTSHTSMEELMTSQETLRPTEV
nr:MAG: coat protein [Wufeng shrew carmotetravirus 1]